MLACFHNRIAVDDSLHGRIRLDRRRLEAAHLKYAVLTVQNHYPSLAVHPIPMSTDVSSMLQMFTPAFYDAFTQMFSGEMNRCYTGGYPSP